MLVNVVLTLSAYATSMRESSASLSSTHHAGIARGGALSPLPVPTPQVQRRHVQVAKAYAARNKMRQKQQRYQRYLALLVRVYASPGWHDNTRDRSPSPDWLTLSSRVEPAFATGSGATIKPTGYDATAEWHHRHGDGADLERVPLLNHGTRELIARVSGHHEDGPVIHASPGAALAATRLLGNAPERSGDATVVLPPAESSESRPPMLVETVDICVEQHRLHSHQQVREHRF